MRAMTEGDREESEARANARARLRARQEREHALALELRREHVASCPDCGMLGWWCDVARRFEGVPRWLSFDDLVELVGLGAVLAQGVDQRWNRPHTCPPVPEPSAAWAEVPEPALDSEMIRWAEAVAEGGASCA